MNAAPEYDVTLSVASSGYDRETCWVQTRAGALPPSKPGAAPTVVLTMQKLLLSGSDVFYAIHSTRTDDMGETWTPPREHAHFRRDTHVCGLEQAVCDFWPRWHRKTRTLLGTGHIAVYQPDNSLSHDRARSTAYAVYDPATHDWHRWRALKMPAGEKFHNSGAGCTQRVDLDNGEILLPIYFKVGPDYRSAAMVARCSYDGTTLSYVEHGTELTVDVQRGFVEPSLAHFRGRYYLTLRNDEAGHVAVGDDGLHFGDAQPWRFDDGELIGNYNTQQHWVTHSDALFLVYTRRGLNNDHVFRHRAPLVMAQVDTERLCLLRDTERVIVPERGARLGNFGVCDVSPDETWVIAGEWMQTTAPNYRDSTVCEKYGSDNSVFAARIRWKKPNALFAW